MHLKIKESHCKVAGVRKRREKVARLRQLVDELIWQAPAARARLDGTSFGASCSSNEFGTSLCSHNLLSRFVMLGQTLNDVFLPRPVLKHHGGRLEHVKLNTANIRHS